MKTRVLALLALVVGVAVGLAGPVAADETATVEATVTVQQVAVSVSPPSVAYGTLLVGDTNKTPSPVSFDATNDGNVNQDFAIRGSDTDDWTLAGTAGDEQYVHRFSPDNSTFTALTTPDTLPLASDVVPLSSQTVHLNLDMPTQTSATAQQTATVTVVATAH